MRLNYIVIVILLSVSTSFSQVKQDCKVLNEELKGTYVGECHNGLAHGKGEFNFADGSFVYVGYFKDGEMDGRGEMFSIVNRKRKSLKKGNWEKNVYVGDKSKPYIVGRTENLDRHTVTKSASSNKTVMINFYQNGGRNNVSNLNVAVNNGDRIVGNYTEGFENVSFPFTCFVRYTTRSKLNTTSYTVYFEVEINEPGAWEIFLYN